MGKACRKAKKMKKASGYKGQPQKRNGQRERWNGLKE
jgi:hypothetical protein